MWDFNHFWNYLFHTEIEYTKEYTNRMNKFYLKFHIQYDMQQHVGCEGSKLQPILSENQIFKKR